MGRTNFAPTARTIIVALVLIVIGLLGTYGTMVPDMVGILAFVVASDCSWSGWPSAGSETG